MNVRKYEEGARNPLANCMLPTAAENEASGKGDTPPAKWLWGKPAGCLALHLLPADPDLWELENYDAFVQARKVMFARTFDRLRQPALPAVSPRRIASSRSLPA